MRYFLLTQARLSKDASNNAFFSPWMPLSVIAAHSPSPTNLLKISRTLNHSTQYRFYTRAAYARAKFFPRAPILSSRAITRVRFFLAARRAARLRFRKERSPQRFPSRGLERNGVRSAQMPPVQAFRVSAKPRDAWRAARKNFPIRFRSRARSIKALHRSRATSASSRARARRIARRAQVARWDSMSTPQYRSISFLARRAKTARPRPPRCSAASTAIAK